MNAKNAAAILVPTRQCARIYRASTMSTACAEPDTKATIAMLPSIRARQAPVRARIVVGVCHCYKDGTTASAHQAGRESIARRTSMIVPKNRVSLVHRVSIWSMISSVIAHLVSLANVATRRLICVPRVHARMDCASIVWCTTNAFVTKDGRDRAAMFRSTSVHRHLARMVASAWTWWLAIDASVMPIHTRARSVNTRSTLAKQIHARMVEHVSTNTLASRANASLAMLVCNAKPKWTSVSRILARRWEPNAASTWTMLSSASATMDLPASFVKPTSMIVRLHLA